MLLPELVRYLAGVPQPWHVSCTSEAWKKSFSASIFHQLQSHTTTSTQLPPSFHHTFQKRKSPVDIFSPQTLKTLPSRVCSSRWPSPQIHCSCSILILRRTLTSTALLHQYLHIKPRISAICFLSSKRILPFKLSGGSFQGYVIGL
jgi:hypothetical protein